MNFGERAGHDHVFAGRYELYSGLVVVAPDIFRVGGIEHQQHVRTANHAANALSRQRHIGAGGVVRVGEKYDLGALAYSGQNGIDIGSVVSLRRRHWRCA